MVGSIKKFGPIFRDSSLSSKGLRVVFFILRLGLGSRNWISVQGLESRFGVSVSNSPRLGVEELAEF